LKTTKRSEHVEQREFVSWFRKSYPGVRIFAIPNGGKRSLVESGRLKVEGVSSGVPDLCIPAWCTWVEMKAVGGLLSKDQREWRQYLHSVGHKVIVAFGTEDAKAQISALRTP
jgi:hypothetical protein